MNTKRITQEELIKLTKEYGTVQLAVYQSCNDDPREIHKARLLRDDGLCTYVWLWFNRNILKEHEKVTNLKNVKSCFCFYENLTLKKTVEAMFEYDGEPRVGEVWTADGKTRLFPDYKEFK